MWSYLKEFGYCKYCKYCKYCEYCISYFYFYFALKLYFYMDVDGKSSDLDGKSTQEPIGFMALTDEYLKRFPVSLRACLEDEEKKTSFAEEIITDYSDLEVYRAVTNADKVTSTDFLGNVEKRQLDGQPCSKRWIRDYHYHSVSVNESIKELIKVTKFPNEHIQGIAKGMMKCKYGPADFEPERTHHNWYLFDGMNEIVCKEFTPVDVTIA